MDKQTCLILTATVDPASTLRLAVADPRVRYRQYREALLNWIRVPDIHRIVFCENSGYDLGGFERLVEANKRADLQVEFLSLKSPAFPERLGKGYGELRLLRAAFKKSTLIRESDWFVKCTGRHFVANFRAFERFFSSGAAAINVSTDLSWCLTFADSRFFYFDRGFFLSKLGKYRDWLDDSQGRYFEMALAKAVLDEVSAGGRWQPLPRYPRVDGYSGTTGLRYSANPLARLFKAAKYRIKRLAYGRPAQA